MKLMQLHVSDAEKQIAPDGSQVFVLASVEEGSTAVFELAAGAVARPVRHPRVQEVWYVLSGSGRMWRRPDGSRHGDVIALVPGTSLNIPRGTSFQFRCDGEEPLRILGVTVPPWGGSHDGEILDIGEWQETV
jgi:mannose-6-phosphate isomerase-like protein (cupin superfamily)